MLRKVGKKSLGVSFSTALEFAFAIQELSESEKARSLEGGEASNRRISKLSPKISGKRGRNNW